jgi:hypothetical protein
VNGARNLWPWVALALVAVLLFLGLRDLFALRFARGDVFPAYSTLRADPLGTMVLYDGLAGAGVESTRNYRDLSRADAPDGTLYASGVDWGDFADDDVDWWKFLLARIEHGGRVVVAFTPTSPPDERLERLLKTIRGKPGSDDGDGKGGKKDGEKDDEKMPPSEEPVAEATKPELIITRLGLKEHWLDSPKGADVFATRAADANDLPETLPWHTALSFEPTDAAWRVAYSVADHPVVIERSLGAGSIVLVGDAYLLSNEAMLRDRAPGLLAWLQGDSRRAVFDESHLGVIEDRGIASLARHYGLAHAAIVLAVIALLFIWKNASSLVPASESARVSGATPGEFAGRESAAGFVSLLRRTLAPSQLFAACVAEYRRSVAWRRVGDPAREALEALATPDAARDPLAATRRAHELLTRKL